MDRLRQSDFLAVVFLTLLFFVVDIRPAWGWSCSYTIKSGYCALRNVDVVTDNEASAFVWPYETLVLLVSPTIAYYGGSVFRHIPTVVEKLNIQYGYVSRVAITRTLYSLFASTNQLVHVIIDEEGPYCLKNLGIARNRLQYVPYNITKLTNLEELWLYDNEIKFVSMDLFKGLKRLTLLTLYGNRIVNIDTPAILHLSNLAILELGSNNLENLLVKRWNFPNLKVIGLSNNRLQVVQSLSEQFLNLNEIKLGYNKWSCLWLEQTLMPILNSGKIKVDDGNETCSGKNARGLCCYDSLEDVRYSMENSMKEQFEQIGAKLENMETRINARVNEIEGFIEDDRKKLETKFVNVKGDMDRMVRRMEEQIRSLEARTIVKVNQNRDLISKGQDQLSKNHNQMKDEVGEINVEQTSHNVVCGRLVP